jgi:hypothetical protein
VVDRLEAKVEIREAKIRGVETGRVPSGGAASGQGGDDAGPPQDQRDPGARRVSRRAQQNEVPVQVYLPQATRDALQAERRSGNYPTLASYVRHIIERRGGPAAASALQPASRVPVLLIGAADQDLIRAAIAQFRIAGTNLNTLLRDLHVARLDARVNVELGVRIQASVSELERSRIVLYNVLEAAGLSPKRGV